ncbi:MAG: hypothetical protein JO142_12455 [Burkholderiales bacterium]|nr:hypothetical protein [Burkholderiales bacterium]
MRIKRAVEVWEKGMDGAPCGQWPLAETVSTVFLYQLFAPEQRVPDPDMLLSYFLNPKQIAAVQPYVAQEMRADQYDFILTAYGEPEGQADTPPG